jgi:hypothetical protein
VYFFYQSEQKTPLTEVNPPESTPRVMSPRAAQVPLKAPPQAASKSEQLSRDTSQQQQHEEVVVEKKVLSDSVSTLASPIKVATTDGKQYFMVGQPKGQNSKSPRKIIFALPGHGTTAETGYSAWKSHIVSDGTYALAILNWWDGKGDQTSNYYLPDAVLAQIKGFLDTYGYTADDFVVLEGFSRGSANTYPVKAYDMVSGNPVIDAVISASGKYQSGFPYTPKPSEYPKGKKLYQGVPWILVCGGKDPEPEMNGCQGMMEAKSYLEATGANILALLEDPNAGHGAFHQSKLGLVKQALTLLDALPQAK